MSAVEARSFLDASRTNEEHNIEELGQIFLRGAEQKGLEKTDALSIWEYVMCFKGQVRDKTEAINHALLGDRTAYLKAHFPGEFEAALRSHGDVF